MQYFKFVNWWILGFVFNVMNRLKRTSKSLCQKLFFFQNMFCTKIVLNVGKNFCTQHVLPRFELGIFMYWSCHSMNSSYCGLVDAKIRSSDEDLPVLNLLIYANFICFWFPGKDHQETGTSSWMLQVQTPSTSSHQAYEAFRVGRWQKT